MIGVDDRVNLTGDGTGHCPSHLLRTRSRFVVSIWLKVTPPTSGVYVRLPDLTVTIDPQRYTCFKRGRLYRYESLDTDFVRDIEIDADGLVLTYPGLFRRVSLIEPSLK